MRVLVDRTCVEMFVDDGRYAHSTVVFPDPSDTGPALLTINGQAVFRPVRWPRRTRSAAPGAPGLSSRNKREGRTGRVRFRVGRASGP
ncbi:GH32 C-terminal domain-containing protein [Streptomyces collinus]|uniref:GH32 C-terminal domain-containing protein n=1 Tax=Streptomyces TaxID=1883 RepID=UPI0034254863